MLKTIVVNKTGVFFFGSRDKIDDAFHVNQLRIDGFTPYRYNRNKAGGNILYIRKDIY